MSRAAILPYPGDPFLLRYWLDLFFKYWADEIDKLYVYCNTPVEAPVVEYIERLCNHPKIHFTYIDHHIPHGVCINRSLDNVTEDHIMLVEDDAYIFKSGVVSHCFEQVETGNYDIVGSKRGSCSLELLKRAAEVWGIPYEGEGDQGCNFWPCYFFSTKDTLLHTDRDFDSRAWVLGDIIAPLNDYVVEVPVVASDTFVWASLQLHAMIPESRIHYVNQYHASPDDFDNYAQGKYLFDGRAPWTHIGSLSSGASGAIMDDQGRSVAKRKIEPPHGPTALPLAWCDITSQGARSEWERRVQFWLTFWENRDPDEITEFAEAYKYGLDQLISQFHLDLLAIRRRQKLYKNVLGI